MKKTITYKKQGNGTDSWVVITYDDLGEITNQELVREDPTDETKKTVKLTDYELHKLMELLK